MPDPLIALENVSVHRESRALLGPLTMAVRSGEFWGVVGPNGAGKSTLLALLAGTLRPSRGRVFRAPGLPASRIGMLFQRHDFLPDLPFTALDVALFGRQGQAGLGRRYSAADQQAARAALRRLGLGALEPRLYRSLSGGERQKTQLARLLAQEAELLLLDEPTTGLDLDWQERLTALVEQLFVEDRRAFVMVVHEVERLPACTTHVLLLSGGRALAAGPPREVLNATLLSQLYACPVEVESTRGRYRAHALGGRP